MAALGDREADLCGDCRRRATVNPLRIFDCKVPSCQPIVDALPHATDYLCDGCRSHFEATTGLLKTLEVDFRVSHRLVRGLDYYTRTTFEILGGRLGAQNALLGGGRYDGLVRQARRSRSRRHRVRGREWSGWCWPCRTAPGPACRTRSSSRSATRRGSPPTCWRATCGGRGSTVLIDYGDRSMKAQMRRANRTSARHVLILGEEELAQGSVTVKDMSSGGEALVGRDNVVRKLAGDPMPAPMERPARMQRPDPVIPDQPTRLIDLD